MKDTTTTWTTVLKIVRSDGVTLWLSGLDRDIEVCSNIIREEVEEETPPDPLTEEKLIIKSVSNYTAANYSRTSTLGVSNADVEGILTAAGINREDIRAGLYDNARIKLYVFDYSNYSIVRILASGYWGECTLLDGRYVAEFRGMSQTLSQSIGRIYTPYCQADFGDTKCGIDVDALKTTGAIDAISTTPHFTFTSEAFETITANKLRGAKIRFDTGDNQDRFYEVRSNTIEGEVTLFIPTAFLPVVGDTFTLFPGCDKQLATCKTYSNVANFRGFPHVPGATELAKIGKSTGTQGASENPPTSGAFNIVDINTTTNVITIDDDTATSYAGKVMRLTSGDANNYSMQITSSTHVTPNKELLVVGTIWGTIQVGDQVQIVL